MLTKKLRFDTRVLEILKAMEWSSDGLQAKIIEHLDRKDYVAVNKALEAMGGAWNRSVGAHLFSADPRPQVEDLLGSGVVEVIKDDFFRTPAEVISHMFSLVPPIQVNIRNESALYLEPEAGDGAICKRLVEAGIAPHSIYCVEINHERCYALRAGDYNVTEGDFMAAKVKAIFDRIYMNPPFSKNQDVDHVMKAFSCLAPKGELVAVMSNHFTFARDKSSVLFRDFIKFMGGRTYPLPDHSFHDSGTEVSTYLVKLIHP